MTDQMVGLLPWVALVLLALVILGLWRRLNKLQNRVAGFEAAQVSLRETAVSFEARLEQMGLDAAALRVSTLGLGHQLERHERSLGLLEAHLGSIQRGNAQESSYAQAIRQASRGQIGVDELVQDYGLPRGEAELLLRMHRQNGSA
ncbi:MAG: DUF2802 domain-containing protein [Pseudomonadota bacterium]